jgi:rRNA-processing protein FCF1
MKETQSSVSGRPKHLLVDTNLLLLLFIGTFDPSRITKFKRTQQFSIQDFDLLVNFLKPFEVITTPHILTEISNLGGQLSHDFLRAFFTVYAKLVQRLKEITRDSSEIVRSELFVPFGLTDAAIGLICSDSIAVLTDDKRLASLLAAKGTQVLSFDALRAMAAV